MLRKLSLTTVIVALVPIAAPASATADVTFTGLVANVCALTTTPGVIGSEGDGKTLSSDGLGGAAATLSVIATGGTPTLTFTAPAATTPAGFSGSATPSISYTSTGGILQALTSSPSTKALNGLLDVLTIKGKLVSTNGFASGTYQLKTTVTCQQP